MPVIFLLKFVLGGTFVVLFTLLGQAVSPKKFAGIFAAAPSIALGSLSIVLFTKGLTAVQRQATGMAVGSVAMLLYAVLASVVIRRTSVLRGSLYPLAVWFILAAGGYLILRAGQ